MAITRQLDWDYPQIHTNMDWRWAKWMWICPYMVKIMDIDTKRLFTRIPIQNESD